MVETVKSIVNTAPMMISIEDFQSIGNFQRDDDEDYDNLDVQTQEAKERLNAIKDVD